MLKLAEINSYYGKSHILYDITMEIASGESVSILGRNGAGKTTLLKTIMGLEVVFLGKKEFLQRDISALSPNEIFRAGIALVPENREIFPNLSVEENLKMGTFAKKRGEAEKIEQIFKYFPILQRLIKRRGDTLSGGEMQMLAIARALMARPKLLLLDEPMEGLAPLIVKELQKVLGEIKKPDRSLLIVEETISVVMEIATRHYVLEKGKIELSGTTEFLNRNREKVFEYLGV